MTTTTQTTPEFEISFVNGASPVDCDDWDAVIAHLDAEIDDGYVIGHSGDLSDGGDRTLFWGSEKESENDDGARALGEVRRLAK